MWFASRFLIGLVVCASATPAFAQLEPDDPTTRGEALRREREAKQLVLAPYEQNAAERLMHLAEERVVPLLNRDGIYARLGSLTTGSGFAYGAGYRDRSLLRGRGTFDVWAAGSLKTYSTVEARASHPIVPGEWATVEGFARRFGYPHEEYFGTGPDSRRDDRGAYDLHGVVAGGGLRIAAGRRLSFGVGAETLRPTADPADSHFVPSIDDVFDEADLPELGVAHRFTRTFANVTFDYRQPVNARRGGWYRVDVSQYDDRRSAAVRFTRVDVELRQYVSLLAERRVFAVRAKWSTTDITGGGAIPFYLLPALGGNDTLRGFRANRFRGPHALLLQGEYRWEIWSGLEAALFADAGKVAFRRPDVNLRGLESDYGFGLRFNTDNGVVVRVDAAFGSRDGKHLHVVFGSYF
jgi:hypothetical protein